MASLVDRLADFRHRRKAAGRGFVVQETDGLDFLALVFAQPGLNCGGIGADAPVRGNELRNETEFFGPSVVNFLFSWLCRSPSCKLFLSTALFRSRRRDPLLAVNPAPACSSLV